MVDLNRPVRAKYAELTVNVTAVLEGTFADWPANIQDGIYRALMNLTIKSGYPYEIIHSFSDKDPDSGPFVYVVARTMVSIQ